MPWGTAAVQKPLTFTDGDVILRSKDGVEFRVDSVILRRASQLFRDLVDIPQSKLGVKEPEVLQREETSDTLDIVLRLLYPVEHAPTTLTSTQGQALLRMVDELGITSHAVNRLIDDHLSSIEPLQAWALAVRFERIEARKAAVRRYVLDEKEPRRRHMKELENISARALQDLYVIKQDAIKEAQNHLSGLAWTCRPHAMEDWYKSHMDAIDASPFESARYTDEALREVLANQDHCWQCLQRFGGGKASRQRANARRAVEALVENAVEMG